MVEVIKPFISGTPWWVWGIFLYVLFVGLKAFRRRIIYLPKLFIIPLVLFAIKVPLFITASHIELLSYILMLFMGLLFGGVLGHKTNIECLEKQKSVVCPGNCYTLILLLLFFGLKYTFGFWRATNVSLATEYQFVEMAASGLISGLFLGRALLFVWRYRCA